METKKNPEIELKTRRPMFFNLGLLTSISIVLFAFEWKTPIQQTKLFTANQMDLWEELPEIPITVHEIPPPTIQDPIIIETDDNEIIDKIEYEIEIDVDKAITTPSPFILIPPVIEKADEILDFTEVMPEPIGGMESWGSYLQKNLRYPTQARRMGVEGTVYVSFIVNKDGSISGVEVLRGIGAGCDDEAIRVIENAARWKPGLQGSRPVAVRMRLPIRFRLN